VTLNVVDDEIIHSVSKFGDASTSSFVMSHNWAFSHKCMSEWYDLEVEQIFISKNKLVNAVKRWHIAYLIEYWVQQPNFTFIQLQCVQTPKCKWYLHREYHKISDLFEITKLKEPYTCVSIFV
jgi:hypothetical protein